MTRTPANPAQVGPHQIGRGQKLLVVAGPCVIESESLTLEIAKRLADMAPGLTPATRNISFEPSVTSIYSAVSLKKRASRRHSACSASATESTTTPLPTPSVP